MPNDEQAIRDLIEKWGRAAAAADLDTLLSLVTDDVEFLTPGNAPFGRDEFARNFGAAAGMFGIEAKSDVREVQVSGDWAWSRNYLEVTLSPRAAGDPMRRTGHVLSIFRRTAGGWALARDANFVG